MLLLLDVLLFVTLLAIGGLCVLLFLRVRRFTEEATRMPVLSDDLASAMTSCRTVLENMQRTASRHGMALTEKTEKAEQSVEELKFLLARAERVLTRLEGKLPAELAPIGQTTEQTRQNDFRGEARSLHAYGQQTGNQTHTQRSPRTQTLDERAMLTSEDTPIEQAGQTEEEYAARRRQPSPQELTAQAELARESALSELQKQYKTDYQFDEKTLQDDQADDKELHRQERAFLSAEEHRLPFSTPNRPMGSAIRRLAKPMQNQKNDAVVMPGRDGVASAASSPYQPKQEPIQKPAALRTTAAAYSQSASRFGGQSYNGEGTNTARKLTTDAEQELRRALKESL